MKRVLILLVLTLAAATRLHADDNPPFFQHLTMTATGATLTAQTVYRQSFAVELQSITGTSTICVEGSESGLVWNRLMAVNATTQAKSLSMTANGLYVGACGSIRSIRVRAVSISGGLVDVGLAVGDGLPNSLTTASLWHRAYEMLCRLIRNPTAGWA